MSKISQTRRIATYLALIMWVGAAFAYTLPAVAQTAAQPRLRIVVRDELGVGSKGVAVKLYFVDDITETPTLVGDAETDDQGILDYDLTRWQVGAYRVRLIAGSSGREVEDIAAQGREYPPLEFRLMKSGDEWLMLVLLGDGRVTPDFSYSLSLPPRIQRGIPATEKPVSYSELLQENGLPIMLPYERDYRPGATVTPLGGSVTGDSISKTDQPQTEGRSSSNASDTLSSILTFIVVGAGFILYLFRNRLSGWLGTQLTRLIARRQAKKEESK